MPLSKGHWLTEREKCSFRGILNTEIRHIPVVPMSSRNLCDGHAPMEATSDGCESDPSDGTVREVLERIDVARCEDSLSRLMFALRSDVHG